MTFSPPVLEGHLLQWQLNHINDNMQSPIGVKASLKLNKLMEVTGIISIGHSILGAFVKGTI